MPVVYQVYVRSFGGVRRHLDHLASLGVDALWLSPIHPSPNVDWGYDVADYLDVHSDYGTLADYDALVAQARERDVDVWLDLVPNHTSDRHPWFTDHPEYYVWSTDVPNDWRSVFTGGSAWSYDANRKRYYLHQFAPQQPDRWQEIAAEYDPKPTLMGETYVELDEMFAYWQHLDLAQNFDFVNSEFTIGELRPIVEQTMAAIPAGRRPIWFGSNHDHSRMATRWAHGNPDKHRACLFLLLTLPGNAILYMGDEIGLQDGRVPDDRILDVADPSRDPERTPMPWTRSGEEWRDPWLPLSDTSRNVEDQDADPGSILNYTRDLIQARKSFSDDGYETLPSERGVWAYRRGDRECVLNMTAARKRHGTHRLAPWEGLIL